MKRTLIRDAKVVLPTGCSVTNVLIENGKIASIDASGLSVADEVIDGRDQVLFPGLIDDQVHFRDPGLTHKEDLATASAACAAGGVTSFLEMPNTVPAAITADLIEAKYEIARQKSIVNHGFYIGATVDNLEELNLVKNVPGIKIFIGSSTGDLLVDKQAALERIFAETSLPICAHCEDESTIRENRTRIGGTNNIADHSKIRDVNAAIVATRRAIDLAVRHQHRFHVLHVSTADEIPMISQARPWLTCEVCPHHLLFDTRDYETLGTLVQMNPSIKPPEHPPALWKAMREGLVQVVATDHAPHTLEEKSVDYPASPSGLPSVENYLSLLLTHAEEHGVTLEQLASMCSDGPARIWGLVGKGRIEVGYDADLVLIDLNREKIIRNEDQLTKCKWSPWSGKRVKGLPVRTIVGGETVFRLQAGEDVGFVDRSHRGQRLQCDHSRGGYWSTPDGIGPA